MREQVIATQGLLGVAAKAQGVVAKMQGLDYRPDSTTLRILYSSGISRHFDQPAHSIGMTI